MDTIMSTVIVIMNKLSLLSSIDVQASLQEWLREQKKSQKLFRNQVSEISTVPPSRLKNLNWQAKNHYDKFYCFCKA